MPPTINSEPLILRVTLLLISVSSVLAQNLEYTTAPWGYWNTFACSADGRVIAASQVNTESVYVSTNSGASFLRTPNLQIRYLAVTPNANALVAVSESAYSYSSHDLGLTWTSNALPGRGGAFINSVLISDDGTKWACADTAPLQGNAVSGGIYASADAGGSWQLTAAPITNWTGLAASTDGTRLAAAYGRSRVYTSPDRGLTWTNVMPAGPTNSFYLMVSSADGNKLIAIGTGIICLSTNGGADWQTMGAPPPGFLKVSASANANTLVLTSGYDVAISTNSGALWGFALARVGGTTYPLAAQDAGLSSDGSRLLTGGYPGLLFTWPPPPAVLSAISDMSNRLVLSWPSNQVGFVLEAAPSLGPGAPWTAVTNNIVALNYRYYFTNSILTPSAFYRLHKP